MNLTEDKILKLKAAINLALLAFKYTEMFGVKPDGKLTTLKGLLMQISENLNKPDININEVLRLINAYNNELEDRILNSQTRAFIPGDYGPKMQINFNELKKLN